MDKEQRRAISRKGGKASHEQGTGHEFTENEAQEAGRKGGFAVSRNPEHMARIGRKGGLASAKARAAKCQVAKQAAEASAVG